MKIKLRTSRQKLRPSTRSMLSIAKRVDQFYLTPEYRAWRETVIARAGRQCEDKDERTGLRCIKAEPLHRMFADHVIEIKDDGARYDPANGRCRCGTHHNVKTADARAARHRAKPGGDVIEVTREGLGEPQGWHGQETFPAENHPSINEFKTEPKP